MVKRRDPVIKMILRTIKGSLGRYIAIVAIIALGSGFFAGLRVTTTAMIETADEFYSQYNFYDFRILSTLGFTEDDVDALSGLDGVSACEGAVYSDFLAKNLAGGDVVFKAHSMMDGINTLKLMAGRMPESDDECLLDYYYCKEEWLGHELEVAEENDEDTLDLFVYDGYTVVGLVYSPYYLNYERGTTTLGSGAVSAYVYIPRGGFDSEYLMELYVKMDASPTIYSAEYDEAVDSIEDALTDAADERAGIRFMDIKSDAWVEVRDAEAELSDGWEDYYREKADTEAELDDAKQKLDDARVELDDGWDEYNDGVSELKDKISDGEAELNDAEAKLADALKELEDGETEYAEGKAELDDGEAEYAEGEKKYKDGLTDYSDGMSEYNKGRAEYEAGYAQYQGGLQQYNDALKQYTDGKAALEYNLQLTETALNALPAVEPGADGYVEYMTAKATYEATIEALNAQLQSLEQSKATLDATNATLTATKSELDSAAGQLHAAWLQLSSAREELDYAKDQLRISRIKLDSGADELKTARKKLDDGWAEYYDGVDEVNDGWAELNSEKSKAESKLKSALCDLEDGESEYSDGLSEYNDGVAEFDEKITDAKDELTDAGQEILDAKEDIYGLEEATVYVLGRSSNIGYACFKSDSQIVAGVARVFPLFFFLVAALICMTTMTRMVNVERTEIGVMKALGYGRFIIPLKYLCYAGSASILGCFIGLWMGSLVFPQVLWQAYTIMYGFADILFVFDWEFAIVCGFAYLVFTVGVTWLSCRGELREAPAELIRPKSPKAGKRVLLERIPFVWKHIGFLRKVSIRNIFRYKKRLFMMILGIGGCTALLLTGFGLDDSIQDFVGYQFDEISTYDASVVFTDPMDESMQNKFADECGSSIANVAYLHYSSVDIDMNDLVKSSYLVATDNSLEGFMDFHYDGRTVEYPGDGECIINYKVSELFNVTIGDGLTFRDSDMNYLTLKVTGIYDNYIYNYIYTTPASLSGWGSGYEVKSAYLLFPEGEDIHSCSAVVAGADNVASVTLNNDLRERVTNMLSSMDYIVALVIICAAALAFIVLYNLTNININERQREIATIKVLGFYRGETAAYVFRENRALTFAGALVGLPLGVLLHAYVMSQIQIDLMSFDVRIQPLSFLYAIVLTMVFGMIVNVIMRFRLDRIDMAESLKSVE